MKRKILQDFANTLCAMFVGWRLGDDYEVLAALPDGTLLLELLGESAFHSSGINVNLWITGELSAWLKHRLEVHGIPIGAIINVSLRVQHKTDRIQTDRKKLVSFDFQCSSTIQTAEKTYSGTLVERHTYHQRINANKSKSTTSASE
jgi:hypothetical protein